ncbi:MAG TPA: ABC transporter permease subunit [Ilumatobacteraceae bacterium]
MTDPIAAYESAAPAGRDGFAQLLRGELTKFRTVRGWIGGLVVGALVLVGFGLLTAAGSRRECASVDSASHEVSHACPGLGPLGPGGEAVTDSAYFVHQAVTGDGTITARVTSLTGLIPSPDPSEPAATGTQPWAKAGIIIRASTAQGSSYAAVMVTGAHGVRLQYDFTNDVAGSAIDVSNDSPQWLRLTRTGSAVTAMESSDGTTWTTIGTVHLAGLSSATVQVGMFVASPDFEKTTQQLGGSSSIGGPTIATATFDHVGLAAGWSAQAWTVDSSDRRPRPTLEPTGPYHETAGVFTISGNGDIAPAAGDRDGELVERSLVGAFAGLIAMIVVGVGFATAEYRRGLIRTTLSASPRRGRVVAAKAVVIGAVTFVAGLVGAETAYRAVSPVRRANNILTLPVPTSTEIRIVVGTAALLAVAAVLAMAIGTVLRRGAAAVVVAIALVVAPYILSVASVLPSSAANWVLQLTPAAAFAIQQSTVRYTQVAGSYTVAQGYFPLSPFAGFAVLVVWTAAALGLAVFVIRRRDA